MSYEYFQGSVFACLDVNKVEMIVNPVNCVGVMGAGLALEFKLRYPNMFAEYEKQCAQHLIEVGSVSSYIGESIKILNFPTKDDWRKPAKMEWIVAGLQNFRDIHKQLNIRSIAFPKLGAGLGGLKWEDVKVVMEKHLQDLDDLHVYVCLDEKEPEGTEAGMLQHINRLTAADLQQIGLRQSAVESLQRNLPVDRFFKISTLESIDMRTYEVLHQHCFQQAQQNANPTVK